MRLVIEIPDNIAPRVIEAVAETYGYREDLGITKEVYAKQQVMTMLREAVVSVEGGRAAENARETAKAKVVSEITLS